MCVDQYSLLRPFLLILLIWWEICNWLSFVILKNLNFTIAESKYNWSSFDFSAVSHNVYTLPESRPGWSDKDVLLFFTFAGLHCWVFFIKGLHFWIRKNFLTFQLDYFPFKWFVWQRKYFPFRKPTLSDFPVQDFSHSTCKCFHNVFCSSVVGWHMHKVKWPSACPVAAFTIM